MTDKFARDKFRAVEPESSRRQKLSGYIFNEEVLRRRVQAALHNLRDALFIWNRVAARPYFKFAAILNQEKLNNCRVFNHRSTLLGSLPKVARSMEIGVLKGEFSKEIIDCLEPHTHTMIDINTDLIDVTLFENTKTEIEIINGKSADTLKNFTENNFDFIYIDAAHDENSVTVDLLHCARILVPNGVIMLNDYMNWSPNQGVEYGVMNAVNDFLNANGFEMIGIAIDATVAYDVALRRII